MFEGLQTLARCSESLTEHSWPSSVCLKDGSARASQKSRALLTLVLVSNSHSLCNSKLYYRLEPCSCQVRAKAPMKLAGQPVPGPRGRATCRV